VTELMPRPAIKGLALSLLLGTAVSEPVCAHSASDAYITLSSDGAIANGRSELHGQWDISLRDLDFVLKLDDDGNGRVTWREVRNHQGAIADYAYRFLRVDGGTANQCAIKPRRQMIDDHADGAYAALFFDIVCDHVARKLTLHYSLFFNIDPSHRGIFVMHKGADIATALFSPDNAKIELEP
jgi:hypothetical protein